ncbi:GAF domain-containing sensor histidine kinase [Pedobacter rhodius]|uniref:histidine kinase n=1 Tax=Pedobacter rhodius TaxID=3004098 RepID=A0ABT4KXC0_9SPHI|nr:HAMP domain-containing sensor histidine kinase [Pedobacter sp. SJ11]MCZ4222887.1 HAMP domain-containing sensor histidine kinase [Pedobacter sp. SJ11]
MFNHNIPTNIIPDYEELRLKKLKDYEILGTPPENAFDTIAILAAEIFDAPFAFITFVDSNAVFFKASIGDLTLNDIKRNESYSAIAILKDGTTVFEDIHKLPEINDVVTSPFESVIRFYAAAPLKTPEGYQIGTVSVADSVPRNPTQKQLNMLERLSTIVMEKLELRSATRKTLRAHDNRLHMLIHDLKNPMTSISLQSELISRINGVDGKATLIAGKITQQSKNIVDNLNTILSAARGEHGSIKLQKSKVNLAEIINTVKQNFGLVLKNKSQSITVETDLSVEIYGDAEKLYDIFGNLISNAVKYSAPGQEIKVSILPEDDKVTVAVKDDGPGLLKEDIDKLFIKFARLSTVSTGRERSNGLGLSMVKMLVDLHKGKVWAESEGKDKGTTFLVELPVK